MTVAKAIKDLRMNPKLSQAALGVRLNLSMDSIRAWEQGRTRPGAESLGRLLGMARRQKRTDLLRVFESYLADRYGIQMIEAESVIGAEE